MSEFNAKASLWPNGSPEEWSNNGNSNMIATSNGITVPQPNNPPASNACCIPASLSNYSETQKMHQQYFREFNAARKQYLAEEAYAEIISTHSGLYVQGRSGKLHCVFQRQFLRCVLVNPDVRYHTSRCYYIYFSGTSEPLILTEREFDNPKRLAKALSQHFNTPVKKYGSQSKTDTLLRMFFASECEVVDIHYYFGWKYDDGIWNYHLWNGKTHATSSEDILNLVEVLLSEDNSVPVPMCASATLVSIEQTVEMMYIITSKALRALLWVMLHTAALFKLLDGIDFRIPMGLCLTSSDPRYLMAIEPLLNWFGDSTIQLSVERNRFSQLLKERCDQPLVVWDTQSQIDNSKILIQCVKTGDIESVSYDDTIFLRLMAMPFILTTGSTTLSFSSDFIPVEIGSGDLRADAYDVFTAKHDYFEDYLTNVMCYVEKNQSTLESLINKHLSQIINQSEVDLLSSREHLQMLAIFRGIREMMIQYYNKLDPPQKLRSLIYELLSHDSEAFLISALRQTSHYQDSSATVEAVFFATANQMLLANNFDLRRMGDENINAPCAPDKKGIVFWNRSMAGFTTEAFRAICTQCGYSTRKISQALMETNAFVDQSLNNSTYLSKLHGVSLQTKSDYVPVYKFAVERLAVPRPQGSKIKAASECDFTLRLGADIDGRPMVWRGIKNSHMSTTGISGSGKSYFIKKVITQLPEQNVRCIIFDTAGDFSRFTDGNPPDWPPAETEVVNITDNCTQINPFLPLFPEETNEMIATRFLDLFIPELKLGVRQESLLRECIQSGLDNQYLSSLSDLSMAMKIGELDPHVARKINSLCSRLPQGTIPLHWNLDKPGITILNLHNYCGDQTIQLLMEIFLANICSLRMSAPQEHYPPVVLVLDECQILNWNPSSCINRILRRGRKYGLAAWLSTQYVVEKKVSLALEQADLRIYFMPTSKEISSIARVLTTGTKQRKQIESTLAQLSQGQFVCKLDDQVRLSAPPA